MARARTVRATVALALRAGRRPDEACLPAGSAPRCQKDLSWAGLAPRAAALSATTEIGFSGPFFTRSRKIGSCEIDTRGWLQRSSPGPRAASGSRCRLRSVGAQSGNSAGHFRLYELEVEAQGLRREGSSVRRKLTCPAS